MCQLLWQTPAAAGQPALGAQYDLVVFSALAHRADLPKFFIYKYTWGESYDNLAKVTGHKRQAQPTNTDAAALTFEDPKQQLDLSLDQEQLEK